MLGILGSSSFVIFCRCCCRLLGEERLRAQATITLRGILGRISCLRVSFGKSQHLSSLPGSSSNMSSASRDPGVRFQRRQSWLQGKGHFNFFLEESQLLFLPYSSGVYTELRRLLKAGRIQSCGIRLVSLSRKDCKLSLSCFMIDYL